VSEGFTQGFVVLSDVAGFLYKATDYYAPEHERCIRWDDPDLGINWPLTEKPHLSGKDAVASCFKDAKFFV
jgi:dTDP-4-dehydrorhamnose 3,5-epimerase